MESPARILFIEDNEADAELEIRQIRRAGISCSMQRVESEATMRSALEDFAPNLIIADFTLPGFSGSEALAVAAEEVPDIPFIFVSGTIGEQRAVTALQHGAVDYILKGNLARLPYAVRRALDEAQDRAARRKAEENVRQLSGYIEGRYGIAPSELSSRLKQQHALEYRLRHALEHNEFKLFYQPQIDRRSGRVVGAEALLRWEEPHQGLIAPAGFLHVLESTSLIVPVGEWVLSQAAEDCARWQRLNLAPVRVAVNVSPVQLKRCNFGTRLLTLAGLKVWSSCGLEVEVTEEAMLDDPASLLEALRSLRESGVRVAIDDFGTGYSSLGRLSQLPLDTLKIDQSFTRRLTEDPTGKAVVSTIIALAGSLNLDTVAEGVETVEQLALLEELGCGQSQGYLHSPPLPVAAFEAMLAVSG